jgi:hypothetical protein
MEKEFEFKFNKLRFLYAEKVIDSRKQDEIIPNIELLSKPSTKILPKQVSAINSIRYGLEICNKSYLELTNQLRELTQKTEYSILEFPYIFLNAWTIINHTDIISQIIKRIFPEMDVEKHFKEIFKTRTVRNSMQHIDHRLSQEVFENEFAIYGSLSWSILNPETNEMVISTIYSGNVSNKNKSTMPMKEFVDKSDLKSEIQQIELSYVNADKNEGFISETINIKKIMLELKNISKFMITNLENILKEYPEQHTTDIMINLKGILQRRK